MTFIKGDRVEVTQANDWLGAMGTVLGSEDGYEFLVNMDRGGVKWLPARWLSLVERRTVSA